MTGDTLALQSYDIIIALRLQLNRTDVLLSDMLGRLDIFMPRLPDDGMVRFRFYALLAAIAIGIPASFAQVHASTFGCTTLETPRNKLICSDTELNSADTVLRETFSGFRRLLSPAAAALVSADQAEWLHWLDLVCPANPGGVFANQRDCFKARYDERQASFAQGVYRSPAGQLFYMRSHFVYLPGTKRKASQADDADFGAANYEWPQIDTPDANAQNWNKAVLAAAIRSAGDPKARTLDAAYNDAGGTMSLHYRVDAANQRFIAVTLTPSRYRYGRPHPQTGNGTFLYWLAERRACRPEDIFRPGSPWRARVINLAIAKLQAMDEENAIWKGNVLRKGVVRSAPHITNWSPSRKALAITFGLSAVAPYSSGMPSVNLLWSELASVMNPLFKPEALPLPAPPPDEEIEY